MLRAWHGLSQQTVADRTGIDRSRLGRLELGKGKLTLVEAKALARLYNIHSPADLPLGRFAAPAISDAEQTLLDRYRSLAPSARALVDALLAHLSA